jgi:hypothetical protein
VSLTLRQAKLKPRACRYANDRNSTGKAEIWIRFAVGTVFAFGAIFCLFKGTAPVETMSFVVATQALLGRPSGSTVAAKPEGAKPRALD